MSPPPSTQHLRTHTHAHTCTRTHVHMHTHTRAPTHNTRTQLCARKGCLLSFGGGHWLRSCCSPLQQTARAQIPHSTQPGAKYSIMRAPELLHWGLLCCVYLFCVRSRWCCTATGLEAEVSVQSANTPPHHHLRSLHVQMRAAYDWLSSHVAYPSQQVRSTEFA